MTARGKTKPKIIVPGDADNDAAIPAPMPPKKENIVIYGGSGEALSRKLGDYWFNEDDLSKGRMRWPSEGVVAALDSADVREYVRRVDRRLAAEDRKKALDMLSLYSVGGPSFEVAKYLDNMPIGGAPLEQRSFCERLGFDEHLYPLAVREAGGRSREEYDANIWSLMADGGFRDKRSFGRFLSLAYPKTGDTDVLEDSSRFFFAILAKPLLDVARSSENPDRALENIKLVLDHVPPKGRAAANILLGDHPGALRRLSNIGWHEGEKLGEFFRQLVKDPSSFDLAGTGKEEANDVGVFWDRRGVIERVGALEDVRPLSELRINVGDYSPLRKTDVAAGFKAAWDGFAMSKALLETSNGAGGADGGKASSSAYYLGMYARDSIVRESLDDESLARAAGVVAGLRLVESTLSKDRGRHWDAGLVDAVSSELGVTGADHSAKAAAIRGWCQGRWQRVDEHVREKVRGGDKVAAYERLSEDLLHGMESQADAVTSRHN